MTFQDIKEVRHPRCIVEHSVPYALTRLGWTDAVLQEAG